MMLHYRRIDVACLLFLLQLSLSSCFQIHPRHPTERIFSNTAAVITDLSKADTAASGVSLNSKKVKNDDDDSWDEKEEVVFVPEEDFEILFGEEEQKKEENLDPVEKAWRYAKKPLLSVGAKGATFSHGNSLRQLLEAHTVVKVKVNTQKFGKCN